MRMSRAGHFVSRAKRESTWSSLMARRASAPPALPASTPPTVSSVFLVGGGSTHRLKVLPHALYVLLVDMALWE